MKELLVVNIGQADGLFQFVKSDMGELKDEYEIINCPEDSLNSIDDLAENILDENQEDILVYLNQNNRNLVLAILKRLFWEGNANVSIICDLIKDYGYMELYNNRIKVFSGVKQFKENYDFDSNNTIHIDTMINTLSTPTEEHLTAMQNGFDMFLTGSYPGSNYISSIKHMEIEKDVSLPFHEISYDLLNINSALIVHVDKPSTQFWSNLKQETDSPIFSHIHQWSDSHISYDNKINHVPINRLKYSEYVETDNPFTYLEISDRKDIEALIKDIEYFGKTGKLLKKNCRIVNSCSWSNQGCGLFKLSRCKIDSDYNVAPCPNCSTNIGKVTDEYFEIVKNASMISNRERLKRNCTECPVNHYCSKCSMLPDHLETDLYCNTMRSYPLLIDYIFKFTLFSDMVRQNKIFAGIPMDQLEISNLEHPLVFDYTETNQEVKSTSIFTAFVINKDYYIISYKMPKIIRTEARLVYIAEGYVRGVDAEIIVDKYSRKFHVPKDEAREHVYEALKIIKEGKIV